ncbi:MAG: serine/threonine protein phosphatase, partial [Flammeovirgaceae bacterium]|nr:serine/threonine protein phosphatase [Flammeovirgaceae bacterium]MDW8288622.1 serine/threonine protein phosphatase [Flammeovirgaceae bacterium]
GNALEHYVAWIHALPYYYELDTCFLVHAGFNFSRENPFEDTYSMLWIRHMKPHPEKQKGKFVVHGHTPTALQEIRASIAERRSIINLDNGCVYSGYSYEYFLGCLLCLDIDSFELYVQNCID